ncbi:DUF5906 domain-containing protein [Thioclava sp. GXIMD4215]|uniref:DUF5906 domain-containing protein n=1 Tax=Thioclava sp. GXIMD4215 TaxID=3131928 RepID=UPI003243F831
MNFFNTDLSDLLDWAPPEKENAAADGPRNGADNSAAQEIAYSKDSKKTCENQAWAALDAAPQWCAWREEMPKEKLTKVPYASPQRKAAADNPATWLTRTRAEVVAADLLSGGRKGGVGLFLGGEGELRFGGIDLDSCLGLLGDLTPWAEEVLTRFPSYAEVSPSGSGVKVFFRYRAEDLELMRAIMGTKWGCNFSRGEHTEIGMFLGNKYFTVTGQRLDSAPATIETVDRSALEWLITDAGPRFKGEELATAPKDDSRSGRAFRIAGECRRAGLDLDAFKAELAKDPHLAKWAKDARQVQRAWDRNAGEDLSTVTDDFDDLPELTETGARSPVTALNRDHAAVMIGGKFRIIREKGSDYDVFAPEELHKLNANNRVKVPGEKRTEPVTSAWMRHPSRRTFAGGLVFNPKETPAGAYNIWRGWAVQPNPDASCDLFLAHVRDVICDGSERDFKWLLGWMAHLVQHPEQKPGTAVVLRGAKGAGKDTVGHYLGTLFPRHHVTLSQPEHLTGRFNAHMETAILIHLEEGYWAGNHAAEGVLKNLITCQSLEIERKGVDPYKIDHFGRLLITSNADWVVPATPGERRFFVLDVSPAHAKDTAYFSAIWKEQANGGAGALLHFLQSFDLSGFDVRNPPETAALTRQKLEGLRNVAAWWHDRLSEGSLSTDEFSEDRPSWESEAVTVSSDLLRRVYEEWLSGQRWHGNAVSARQFGKDMRDMCGGMQRYRAHVAGGRQWQYTVPPLAECRAAFAAFIGGEMEWDQ